LSSSLSREDVVVNSGVSVLSTGVFGADDAAEVTSCSLLPVGLWVFFVLFSVVFCSAAAVSAFSYKKSERSLCVRCVS
jgi:hypothetical protein